MRYFTALKEGQKRVGFARKYLSVLAGDKAMPALALHDTTTSSWEPVGNEILYAFVSESSGFVLTDSSGYILVLVDSTGTSKAIAQGISPEEKKRILETLDNDGVREYKGTVILPM